MTGSRKPPRTPIGDYAYIATFVLFAIAAFIAALGVITSFRLSKGALPMTNIGPISTPSYTRPLPVATTVQVIPVEKIELVHESKPRPGIIA